MAPASDFVTADLQAAPEEPTPETEPARTQCYDNLGADIMSAEEYNMQQERATQNRRTQLQQRRRSISFGEHVNGGPARLPSYHEEDPYPPNCRQQARATLSNVCLREAAEEEDSVFAEDAVSEGSKTGLARRTLHQSTTTIVTIHGEAGSKSRDMSSSVESLPPVDDVEVVEAHGIPVAEISSVQV